MSAFVRGRDRGSASILVLTGCLVAGFALLVALAVSSVTLARHRAQSAADLAALAAAGRLGAGAGEAAGRASTAACERARRVAVANAARLEACTALAGSVLVVLSVPARLPWLLGGRRLVRAASRAGPEPGPPAARPTRDGSRNYPDVSGTSDPLA